MTTATPRTRPAGRTATWASFACATLATLAPPTVIVLGVAALVLAVVAWRRGDRLARVALAVAALVVVFGLVTGGVLVLVDELGVLDTGWGG